jgi:iron complex transport system substrate-binding protein
MVSVQKRKPALKELLLAALSVALFVSPAYAEPRRVVSMSICQDVILAHVADREQIAALSHYSRDMENSPIGEFAQTIPITYESAEEVIALGPDLILTSRHSDLATRNALKRLGIKTELFAEPKVIDESLEQIRRIAQLVNREERGEALIAGIDEALRKAAPAPGTRPVTAMLFQRNGFSTGDGSLMNAVMTYVGLVNVMARDGFTGWGYIPLERIIADPPDVLLATAGRPDKPTWADRVIRHPALKGVESRMVRYTFPERYINCGGPVLADAAAAMAEARDLVLNKERQ